MSNIMKVVKLLRIALMLLAILAAILDLPQRLNNNLFNIHDTVFEKVRLDVLQRSPNHYIMFYFSFHVITIRN